MHRFCSGALRLFWNMEESTVFLGPATNATYLDAAHPLMQQASLREHTASYVSNAFQSKPSPPSLARQVFLVFHF